jgi:tetratricopeptide (TPR) repeat protein
LIEGHMNPSHKANMLRLKADGFIETGEYQQAKRYLMAASVAANQAKNKTLIALNLSTNAVLESKLNNVSLATDLFQQAATALGRINDFDNAGIVYHKRAIMHFNQEQYEEALQFWINAAHCFWKTQNLQMYKTSQHSFYHVAESCEDTVYLSLIARWHQAGLKILE